MQSKQQTAAESQDNFRWLFTIASSLSTYNLSQKDLIPTELTNTISNIGQFAEIAHGSLSPRDIFSSLDILTQPRFPLQSYNFLRGAKLLKSFRGSVADLQGYTAVREKSLVVAFSGTSSFVQAIQDLKIWPRRYPLVMGATVHSGFWNLFEGIRDLALEAIKSGIDMVEEVIFTAHSMGGVMAYFLLLELMEEKGGGLLKGKKVRLVVFGCPRAGNNVLVGLWKTVVERWKGEGGSFEEISVRAYNDGVPSVPPGWLGYAHFASSPIYLYHERLYRIHPSQAEYTNFTVLPPPEKSSDYPLGGHNYYNGRDMESLQRSMGVARESGFGGEGRWEERFLKRIEGNG